MKCQCDSCRQLALSGKYICHSCAERFPHDGVRWMVCGNGKIRIYVDGYTEVEVVQLQMPDRLLFFYIEKLEPWWQRVKRTFTAKVVSSR